MAVKAMYDSNVFTRDEMMEWEEKAVTDKTWVHLQDIDEIAPICRTTLHVLFTIKVS